MVDWHPNCIKGASYEWLRNNLTIEHLMNMCGDWCIENCISWRVYAGNRIMARISGVISKVCSKQGHEIQQECHLQVPGHRRISLVNQLKRRYMARASNQLVAMWYLMSINSTQITDLEKKCLTYHIEYETVEDLERLGLPQVPDSLAEYLLPAWQKKEDLAPQKVDFTPEFIANEVAQEDIEKARAWMSVNERRRRGLPYSFFGDPSPAD